MRIRIAIDVGDESSDISPFEACVDIDDGDVRSAAIEHAEQGGEPAEICTVSDARRDRDDGASNVSGQGAR